MDELRAIERLALKVMGIQGLTNTVAGHLDKAIDDPRDFDPSAVKSRLGVIQARITDILEGLEDWSEPIA